MTHIFPESNKFMTPILKMHSAFCKKICSPSAEICIILLRVKTEHFLLLQLQIKSTEPVKNKQTFIMNRKCTFSTDIHQKYSHRAKQWSLFWYLVTADRFEA